MKLRTKKRIRKGVMMLIMLVTAFAFVACGGTPASDENTEFDEAVAAGSFEEEEYYDEEYEEEFGPDDEIVMPDTELGNLIMIKKDGKYGALDETGEQVFPYEYSWIEWVAPDRYVVSKHVGERENSEEGTQTALVNEKNEILVPFGKYDFGEAALNYHEWEEGWIDRIVATDCETGRQGYYSAVDNTWAIEPEYKEAEPFEGPLTAVKDQNDRWGFINAEGEYVIPAKYKKVDKNSYYGFSFDGDAATVVTEDGKTAFVLKTGEEIYPPKVKKGYKVIDYRYGCFVVQHGESVDGLPEADLGVANKKGKIIIPAKYWTVGDDLIIDEDKIAVRDEKQDPEIGVVNEWTTFNHKGKKTGTYSEDEFYRMEWSDSEDEDEYEEAEEPDEPAIPNVKYEEIEATFDNGLILVKDAFSGNYGFINAKGEQVTEFKFKVEHEYC